MQAYGEVALQPHAFLTSAQFHALAALSTNKEPSTRLIEDWVSPRAGMDVVTTKYSIAWCLYWQHVGKFWNYLRDTQLEGLILT